MRALLLLSLSACLPDLGARSIAAHEGRCGDCHTDHAEAFADSRHAQADSSELFRTLRDASQEPAFCDGCHLPPQDFTCATCHGAAGNQGPSNGLLLHDLTGPVRGPFGTTNSSHESVQSDFLVGSELCATCHEVDGDGVFQEHPWQEWQRSMAYKQQTTCQDCHMSPEPGVAAARERRSTVNGGTERRYSDHGFVGLQRDPEALLTAGLELTLVDGGVEIYNRAGHALPSGAAFTRELWVQGQRGEAWVGDGYALHPMVTGELSQASVLVYALEPDERRFLPIDDVDRICVRYRNVARSVSQPLGMADVPLQTLHCVSAQ